MALNTEYDIVKAFEAIENELIASMIRNMKDHKLEEISEDKQWTMWQAEQLKSLEKYRRSNQEKFGSDFSRINSAIEELIRISKDAGEMDQEIEILKAIKKGFSAKKVPAGMSAEFFKLNDRKLDALIESVLHDMNKAETAILRMANDQYRKIIYNAQVYANTGAGTYEKAVDMATKDFLAAGLNCVEYANGARHTLKDYADMAIRTASKRAYLQGEGVKRQEWGISTVIVNKRGNPCPKCLPFCGKVLIDDVWSGGSKEDGKYPLMSYAIQCGLYHPRCKDVHTTYFPGISTADDTWTKKELEDIGINAKNEAKLQYAKRQEDKFGRLAKYSLDKDNKNFYHEKEKQWNCIANDTERSIIKNIQIPTEALDIDGFTEEILQASQEAIDDLSKEYKVMLDDIVVEALGDEYKNVPFQFQARQNGNWADMVLVVNKEYPFPNDIQKFNGAILKSKTAAKSVSDLINHELAHVMTYQNLNMSQINNLEIPFIRGISGYADDSQDGAESLAEAFVRFKNGEGISQDAMELIDKYILKWRK